MGLDDDDRRGIVGCGCGDGGGDGLAEKVEVFVEG